MRNALAAVLESPRNLVLREIPIPDVTSDDAVLRVEACGLCGTDYEQWQGHLTSWGAKFPVIPGHEVIGVIDTIGAAAAKRWCVEAGDRVAVEPVIPCGSCRDCLEGFYTRCQSDLGYGLYLGTGVAPGLWGGYATHLYLHPRSVLHKLPTNADLELLGLINPLSNAIRWMLDAGGAGLGSRVVILGPGQRGILAAAAAAEAGAAQIIVTGTNRDLERLEVAKALGATHTINCDVEDPVQVVSGLTNGQLADIVLDVSAGAVEPVIQAVDICRRGGRIILAGLKGHNQLNGFPVDKVVFKEIEIRGVLSAGRGPTEKAALLISKLGEKLRPLCSRTFPLEMANVAVATLGREFPDTDDVIHITLMVKQS